MAVYNSNSKAGPFVADGSQKEFPFRFPILETDHITVYEDGEILHVSRYYVETSGLASGGTVVFYEPPAAGSRIAILRDVPLTQETDIQNNTAFNPEVLEVSLDKLTMICQQNQEELQRCAKVPATSDVDPVEYLEDIVKVAQNSKDVALNSAVAAANSAQTSAVCERNVSLIWANISGDASAADRALATAAEAAEATGAITLALNTAIGEINGVGATAIAATQNAAMQAKEAADLASNTAGAITGSVDDAITLAISQAVGAQGALGAAIEGGKKDVEAVRQDALEKANEVLKQFNEGTAEFEQAKAEGLSEINQKVAGVALDVETVLARAQQIADGYLTNAQATVSGSLADLEKIKAAALASGDKALAALADKRIGELTELQGYLTEAGDAASAAEQFRNAASADAVSAKVSADNSASSASGALASAQAAAKSASDAAASAAAASATSEQIVNQSLTAHNASGSAHSDLFNKKLDLSGGTMSGPIYTSSDKAVYRTGNNGQLTICGAELYDNGSSVSLYGKSHAVNAGNVVVAARKDGMAQYLYLKPDGSATWCGKNLVRSVDGVAADTAGNVSLNALPKSGGTMTGTIAFTVDGAVKRSGNANCFVALGGDAWEKCGSIALHGGGDASNPGYAILYANNNSGNQSNLVLKPTGELEKNGRDITLGYPNYSAGIALGTLSSYTAADDGWILVHVESDEEGWNVRVNGATVGYEGGDHWQHTSEFLPVKKGDVVTSTKAAGYIFYPNR